VGAVDAARPAQRGRDRKDHHAGLLY
jgi:hypothetical protein